MRDCRNEFIQNLRCSIKSYLGQTNMDKVMAHVIELLSSYELSERITDVAVLDDANTRLVKTYMSGLILDGKSEKTAYVYLRHLKRFCDFLGGKNLISVTTFDIRNYLANGKVRGLSNVSLENTRTTLSAFFQWLSNEEYIDKNPCSAVKPIKCTKEIKQPFSVVEQDAIKKHCSNLKERAIVELLLSSGVRVSELVDLDVSDVDFNNKALRIRHGKGDKERVTYINELTLNYLVKYLTDAKVETGALFQTNRHKKYTTSGIRRMLSRLAERARVENVHPHRFRRTFATTLASRGMDIQDIKTLMGHTDINTTMLYVTSNNIKVNNSYRKFTL